MPFSRRFVARQLNPVAMRGGTMMAFLGQDIWTF
jgi:hypothetical protein